MEVDFFLRRRGPKSVLMQNNFTTFLDFLVENFLRPPATALTHVSDQRVSILDFVLIRKFFGLTLVVTGHEQN